MDVILLAIDRLLARFDPGYRWRLLGILLLSAVQTLLVVARPFPVKLLLEAPPADSFAGKMVALAGGNEDRLLLIFIGAIIAIELGVLVFRMSEEFASTSLSESFMRRIRGAIARGLMRGPWQQVADQSIGRVLAAATGDVEVVQRLIKDVVVSASIAALQLSLMLVVIYHLHPALFFVLLAEIIILSGLITLYANWRKHAYLAQMHNQERYLSWLSTVQGRNLDLRFNLARGLVLRRTLELGRALFRRGVMLWRRQSAYFGLVEFLIGLSSAACLVFLVLESRSTGQQLGTLLVFLYYTVLVFPCLAKIGEAAPLLTDARNARNRLAPLLDLAGDAKERSKSKVAPPAATRGARIELQDIGVRGDGAEWILRHVNLTIEAGEQVALFGESGSGKSTLIRLILGLAKPDEGRVLVNGVDVSLLTLPQRQRLYLFQRSNPVFFAGTVAENIVAGRPALPAMQMELLLGDVLLQRRLAETEAGPDTVMSERGDPFSQGEQQRIGIARCFLADQPLMILDEALNSLDEKGELAITGALRRRCQGQTFLVISHRLSVAQTFPRFVRVVRGEGIVEGG